MQKLLYILFDLKVMTQDRLSKGSLSAVDVVMLCTTEGEQLDAEEQAELQEFVHGGGTAIVSAFANWSAFNHYNRALSQWLGVSTVPRSAFGDRTRHDLGDVTSRCSSLLRHGQDDSTLSHGQDDATLQLSVVVSGPFGAVTELINTGESHFELESAHAIVLGRDSDSRPVSAFFPRSHVGVPEGARQAGHTSQAVTSPAAASAAASGIGVQGRGQVSEGSKRRGKREV
jgi:hypothetical protein